MRTFWGIVNIVVLAAFLSIVVVAVSHSDYFHDEKLSNCQELSQGPDGVWTC